MDMFAAAMRLSSEVLGYLPQHELQEEINLKYEGVWWLMVVEGV